MHSEIKSRIDCITVCESRGYELDRANFIRCADERTASLKVYGHSWRCYRCNTGGDLFDLIEHMENCESRTSLEIGASIAGVTLKQVKKLDTPKKDLIAIREAYETGSFDLPYIESDFRVPALWSLYKMICLDYGTLDTDDLRVLGVLKDSTWNKRHDPIVSRVIDYITLGYDFEGACLEWLDKTA